MVFFMYEWASICVCVCAWKTRRMSGGEIACMPSIAVCGGSCVWLIRLFSECTHLSSPILHTDSCCGSVCLPASKCVRAFVVFSGVCLCVCACVCVSTCVHFYAVFLYAFRINVNCFVRLCLVGLPQPIGDFLNVRLMTSIIYWNLCDVLMVPSGCEISS